MTMESDVPFDHRLLSELAAMRMPFGRYAGRRLVEGGRRVPDDRAEQVAGHADQRREKAPGRIVDVGDAPIGVEGEDPLTDPVEGIQ